MDAIGDCKHLMVSSGKSDSPRHPTMFSPRDLRRMAGPRLRFDGMHKTHGILRFGTRPEMHKTSLECLWAADGIN